MDPHTDLRFSRRMYPAAAEGLHARQRRHCHCASEAAHGLVRAGARAEFPAAEQTAGAVQNGDHDGGDDQPRCCLMR